MPIFYRLLLLILVLMGKAFFFGSPLNAKQDTSYLDLGGALRFNAFVKNWEGQQNNRDQFGEISFDMLRAEVLAGRDGFDFSAQYRFYAGYHMLHHGWLGYHFTDSTHLVLGVSQVPFGILPYSSHNYFFSLAYYLGLEDDYDLGLKFTHQIRKLHLAFAFYKNSEGSFSGSSEASARYSYDIVGGHEEVNQVNARAAYQVGNAEIGFSGQYGLLLNKTTSDFGEQYAFAGHLDWDIGRLNLKAEIIQYKYQLEDDTLDGTVVMGAYDFPYEVADEGGLYIAGLSYELPVNWGPISSLTFYENFSFFNKTDDDFNNSQMNVAGIMVAAGNVYAYFDVASGQSHPWIGPVWSEALARGFGINENAKDPKPEWATRFNLNIGFYF